MSEWKLLERIKHEGEARGNVDGADLAEQYTSKRPSMKNVMFLKQSGLVCHYDLGGNMMLGVSLQHSLHMTE